MTFQVILPFFKSHIRSNQNIQDVETATILLLVFDELEKKEKIEVFSKILLPFIGIEYKEDNFLIFFEFFKNHIKTKTVNLSVLEKSRKILENTPSDEKAFVEDIAQIKHIFETPSTIEIELNSLCSPELCRSIINLSKFSSNITPELRGDEIDPIIDFNVFLKTRANYNKLVDQINDFIEGSNKLIQLIEPKPEQYVQKINNEIIDLENEFDKKIELIEAENYKIINELEPKRENEIEQLKQQEIERSNEVAKKIYEIFISHLKSDIELLPETLNQIISESQSIKSFEKIIPHALQSLKKLEEKTKHILKSVDSTKNAIDIEHSKIEEIHKDIKQKIDAVNKQVDIKIEERKQLLSDLISEKNGLIKNKKDEISKIQNIVKQCIKEIKDKIEWAKNNLREIKKLLNSSVSLNLGEIEPDEKFNLRLIRFKIPIYYVIIRNKKKSTERVFLIPPCVLPMEIKKLKKHIIYGKNAKWIAVDPFDKVFIHEITSPLKELLEKDVLLRERINSSIKNILDRKILEPQFYSGLKTLFEYGYLNKKNYKKTTNIAIEFFKSI